MKINKSIINEASDILDKIEDKAEQELQSEAEKVDKYVYKKRKYDENNLEDVLDHHLMIATRKRSYSSISSGPAKVNLLIEGPAGIGKSEIVFSWAKKNDINLVTITGSELTPDMIQGIPFREIVQGDDFNDIKKEINDLKQARIELEYQSKQDTDEYRKINHDINLKELALDSYRGDMNARFVTNDFFKKLMKPRSILFIDEINRSPSGVRATLLSLIQSHMIPDANSASNRTFAKNFLFTIAAQNPSDDEYDGAKPLDLAMLTRFQKFIYTPTIEVSYDFFEKVFNKEIKDFTEVLNNPRALKQSQENWKSENGGSLDGWIPPEVHILNIKNTLGIIDALRKAPDVEYGFAEGGEKARERGVKAFDAQEGTFNARTLANLLDYCDGDKDIFLSAFPRFCGSQDAELLQAVDDALANFTPIDDEPNKAFTDTNREKSLYDDDEEGEAAPIKKKNSAKLMTARI